MVSPIRAWRRSCAIGVLVCIAAINFAIVHPTATLAWTPTTPQVSVSAFGGVSTDVANAVAVDASGNVYTAGYFSSTVDFDPGSGIVNLTSAGNQDVFVSKLDSSGNFVWAKSVGGGSTDTAAAIAVDASGNVYTTGYFDGTVDFDPGGGISNLTSAGNQDVFVSKLDSTGNFVWAKRLGGINSDIALAVAVDGAGNVFTAGYFSATADFDPGAGTSNLTSAGGSQDVFVSKLDSSGNFVWAKRFGGTDNDVANAVAVDGAGNVYTTGYFIGTVDFDPGAGTADLTSTPGGNTDVFVSKLNSSGSFVWAKSLSSGNNDLISDVANAVAVDGSGNVYTAGRFVGTSDFDPGAGTSNLTSAGQSDVFVSKLNSTGSFVWAQSFGSTDIDIALAVAVDGSGNVFTTGRFLGTVDFDRGAGTANLTSAGSLDAFVLKLNSSGSFVWAKSFGGSGSDNANAVFVDGVGNLYAAGYFQNTVDFDPGVGTSNLTSAGGSDVYVLKLDSSGANNLIAPTVSWTEPSSPSVSRTLSYTLVFNTSVTGLAAGDFSNTGTATGCVFTPSGSSGSSVTVSVACSTDGTVVARIAAGAVMASGMTGPVSGVSASSVTIDTVAPTVSWTEPSSPSSSRMLSYTLVFNRSVTGIAAGDFSNTGTATGCVFTPSSSSGSSVTVSVVCSSDGTVVARIAADAVSASGMTGPVSGVSASSVTIDTVPTPTTTVPTPTTTTAPRTTTTTVGNATTTTVAPSPAVTVAVGQISIATIAPSLPSATTTTTSPARASTTPTPTPPSTVQSTIPVPIATVAPAQPATTLAPIDVPTIPRGGSALRIAGKEVPLKITRRENQLLLNAQNFDAAFSGVRTDGTVIPLDTDGNIRLDKGDAIKVAVTGFAPESQVEIRLYSDPILLGMGAVNDEGAVTKAYQIPETVPAGSHRVVLAGKNYSGDKVVFTVGIVLGAQESASGLVRALIAIPILVAVFLALFLPAFLRRRKKPATV